MLFPTLNFGLFFLIVFAAAWALVRFPQGRIAFLSAASYVFYGWWDWRYLFLLGGSTLFNYLAGHAIVRQGSPARRKLAVSLAVAVNLGVLAFFKYADFTSHAVNDTATLLGLPVRLGFLDMVVPVGISFFTFHGISYLVDLYRGTLRRPASLMHLVLYISFFPQLVAGPIVRASHFLPQIGERPDPDDIRATRAYLLIMGGLFKKVVVANYLATDLVDAVFMDPDRYGALDLLLATYGYAMQIYCDFSAYTDIAIGLAALLGFRFPQNFDQPYRSGSLREFWRRWHISLSSWLRDYLYIPLGGNRGGTWRHCRNLMITMLLGGLWHGANWTFVIWGALHGGMLVTEHLVNRLRAITLGQWEAPPLRGWRRVLAIVATFHFVCFTWIFFRSPTLEVAGHFLAGFGRWHVLPTAATPLTLLLIAGTLASQFLPADRLARIEDGVRRLPAAFLGPAMGAAVGLAVVLIQACAPEGVAPFIYFQF
ncbi:D-alanyl-lipoteichoic acid acyltransferase DltB (MBOAT superfamily) [Nitrospirillum amazonense]|uniref:Probable alginate O-acetylase AlgI n=1 Tax=Nitrospirillum amazonense TaxID=28077 RepID=A0A560FS42_9PROT|nr:MBOAT family protein [Nitrospirillum amazonense]TWB24429.1 D-alanyl-lipoteichoic acid acyltransferase DltB (MBOAT superfamily) [Nitrospirillum amazonense]